jgi:exodeoxyribonuclease VII small subunit
MNKEPSFEEALERLDKIIDTLEKGGLKLEEAIALFEEGIELANICNQRLNAAELKITQLYSPFEKESGNGVESE